MGMSASGFCNPGEGRVLVPTSPDNSALLKQFEPVLKFTRGERFFPYNVADYIRHASLWVRSPDSPPREVAPETSLNLESLGHLPLTGTGDVHYLQFISPMNIRELAEYQISQMREKGLLHGFHPSRNRLARVGYLARLVDVAFSIALLLRGRVPGDAMIAALATFDEMPVSYTHLTLPTN